MDAAVTDVGRSRSKNLVVFWPTDITDTYRRDTTTTYLPPSRLRGSFPSRRTSPPPLPAAILTNNKNMSTSEESSYSSRLWSSTRPNLDDRETGRVRLRSRDARIGKPPVERSGGETEQGRPDHHSRSPRKRFDSLIRGQKYRTNLYRERGFGSSRQLRGSVTRCRSGARQITIAATLTLQARQSAQSATQALPGPGRSCPSFRLGI